MYAPWIQKGCIPLPKEWWERARSETKQQLPTRAERILDFTGTIDKDRFGIDRAQGNY